MCELGACTFFLGGGALHNFLLENQRDYHTTQEGERGRGVDGLTGFGAHCKNELLVLFY